MHTLRAWERRYGVVEPQRSAGGTRLYSTADVLRLRLLGRATEAGHTISQVANLDVEQLRELLRDELPTPSKPEGISGTAEARWIVEELLRATELMDGPRIHSLLMRSVVALPVRGVIKEVVVPVLRQVGDRWAAGLICPANEHLLTVNVRRVLAWLTDSVPVSPEAPTVVLTTPVGQWHEIGSQIAGVLAAIAGWKVVFLGPNLPAEDIIRAIEMTDASAVLLGATMGDGEMLMAELRKLREGLDPEIDMIVGGRGAEPFATRLEELGIRFLENFDELEEELSEHSGAIAAVPA